MLDRSFPLAGEEELSQIRTVDITAEPVDLGALLDYVVERTGRVELVRGIEGTDACVVISKAELDALERALEILAATDDVRGMRDELARVAARAREPLSVLGTSSNGNGARFGL